MNLSQKNQKSKKIGIFGGTFDPIHFGHINLALELMEKRKLDEVWFVPAQINPLKQQVGTAPFKDRLNMLHLALSDIPQFQIHDIESFLPTPSYTLHTLRYILAKEAEKQVPAQFFLLLGEDCLPNFMEWHQPEEIVKLVPLLIGSRTGSWKPEVLAKYPISIRKAIETGMTTTNLMDISATELRKRLQRHLYCGHLIPAKVLDYIHAHALYS